MPLHRKRKPVGNGALSALALACALALSFGLSGVAQAQFTPTGAPFESTTNKDDRSGRSSSRNTIKKVLQEASIKLRARYALRGELYWQP